MAAFYHFVICDFLVALLDNLNFGAKLQSANN